MAAEQLSSPDLRSFLARQESLPPPSSAGAPARLAGAAPIAFGLEIAIEAAVVAGSDSKEK
jgi:hypothetical protein